ncbi:MAG: hypothetical protein J1F31_06830 [Erysipelotrichales bacterium]|nr:hypothetical protein [Erysipelotrichales bacterium]
MNYNKKLDTLEDTYNFEVEDCHTYYVTDSDVLVHNEIVPAYAMSLEQYQNLLNMIPLIQL